MRLTTSVLTAASLIGASLATPAPTAEDYHWSITKWSFCRGQSAYDYSLTVKGLPNGATPAFRATCSGTQQGNYKQCNVVSTNGVSIYANVNIVADPNNPNDNVPRVYIKTSYVDDNGCSYTSAGHHDPTANCASASGSKFSIVPKDTAVC